MRLKMIRFNFVPLYFRILTRTLTVRIKLSEITGGL